MALLLRAVTKESADRGPRSTEVVSSENGFLSAIRTRASGPWVMRSCAIGGRITYLSSASRPRSSWPPARVAAWSVNLPLPTDRCRSKFFAPSPRGAHHDATRATNGLRTESFRRVPSSARSDDERYWSIWRRSDEAMRRKSAERRREQTVCRSRAPPEASCPAPPCSRARPLRHFGRTYLIQSHVTRSTSTAGGTGCVKVPSGRGGFHVTLS